jgi:class 3 adenylate cyclase
VALREELEADVRDVFRSRWTSRDGDKVPEPENLGLGNDAVKLQATVLYADMADSTVLVNTYKPHFAAEIYKTFLLCAGRVIRAEGGAITAYDGDRVMGVFVGSLKNSTAARAGLKIHWAVKNIIRKAQQDQYPTDSYELKHVVGIDTSSLLVARTGFRGANDLVWVGRAANYAAKLAALPEEYSTYITGDVYGALMTESKIGSDGKDMWTPLIWSEYDNSRIYGSTYWWEL